MPIVCLQVTAVAMAREHGSRGCREKRRVVGIDDDAAAGQLEEYMERYLGILSEDFYMYLGRLLTKCRKKSLNVQIVYFLLELVCWCAGAISTVECSVAQRGAFRWAVGLRCRGATPKPLTMHQRAFRLHDGAIGVRSQSSPLGPPWSVCGCIN